VSLTLSNRAVIEKLTAIIESQDEIIDLQAGVISTLLHLLHQHMSAAEMDELPVVEDINKAAALRREMEGL